MLGGHPASGRDVVWKNRKRTSEKLEEILASPPLKRRPVTMLNPGKIPVFFFWCPVREDFGGFFAPGSPTNRANSTESWRVGHEWGREARALCRRAPEFFSGGKDDGDVLN